MYGSPEEWAIARSVIFASLFEYPLTLDQLTKSLLESRQTTCGILKTYEASDLLHTIVERRGDFFFPRGQDQLLEVRRRREESSVTFIARHRLLLTLICALPYVRMVALSGSIAHLNLEGDGDLDLFIITRGRHVWSVTVAVLILAKLFRRRRAVCANFILSDRCLELEQRDLFSASQIIHLKPLVGRDAYHEFVAANPFVYRYHPNFRAQAVDVFPFQPLRVPRWLKRTIEVGGHLVSPLVEAACRYAYGRHLRRRAASWQSPEQVRLQRDCLKLHTQSHRQSVLERFDRAMFDALEQCDFAAAAPWWYRDTAPQ